MTTVRERQHRKAVTAHAHNSTTLNKAIAIGKNSLAASLKCKPLSLAT